MGKMSPIMKPALRAKCDAIRILLKAANHDEIRTRYAIGQLVIQLQQCPEKYGERAVEQAAKQIGLDRSTLYCHGKVASAWTPMQLEALLTTKNPLSWSHLVELARVPDDTKRQALATDASSRDTSTSTRELRKLARAARGVPIGTPAAMALASLLTITEKLKGHAAWDGMISTTPSRDLLILLDRVEASQQELKELCARNVELLRSARQEVLEAIRGEPTIRNSPRGRLLSGYAA